MQFRRNLLGLAYSLVFGVTAGLSGTSSAQMMIRPPAFSAGVPGLAQFDAMRVARHQARTLLYRQALEELERNPRAADLPECHEASSRAAAPCIPVSRLGGPGHDAPPRKFALLIGNNDYHSPIPGLETPIKDVTVISELLEKEYGYRTNVLKNASKAEIATAFNQLATDSSRNDSVLVIYAGHGYLQEETDTGYWIPVDASVISAKNWIANADILRFLQSIPARQTLLISDSCFSGTLARDGLISKRTTLQKEEILRRKTAVIFSSGGEEPVSDEGKQGHSIFAWGLINGLSQGSESAVGYDLYRRVKVIVMESYPQEPRYGELLNAGHFIGNDYFFDRVSNH